MVLRHHWAVLRQHGVSPRRLAVRLLTEALLDQEADLGERYRR
jgi:hypothetical protein